ncbi:SDR family NAD(P)-dependent oxidoreductase [Kineococcus sp. SYSU DK002]|uniref:SDR family NAD(P)-dependent oxidoreductase n=1 Tax=Kineococcus sp. SYSU DK002 TaxID=3383123 RepID=UPI003D7EE6BA
MADRLKDRVALITGAASGLGAAEVRLLAAEGAYVVGADVDTDRLEEVTRPLAAQGLPVSTLALDVTSASAWDEAVRAVEDRHGRLDVLINNAGIVSWGGVEATTEQEWNRVIAVNQTGMWLGMRAAMPLLRASGQGSVVNTSSVLGLVGSGAAAAYQATKGAVRLLTKTAAVEYAQQGVRVNSLHPGVIATPMIQDLLEEQGDNQPDILRTPMRRAGTPEEVAWGVVYLASTESSYVTGTELVIDGGMTAH